MTRTMTLTSSLMMLAVACTASNPDAVVDAVDPGDVPEADSPDNPAPDAPPTTRSLSQAEIDALETILGGLPIDGDIDLGGIDEVGTVTLALSNTSTQLTVMDGIAFQQAASAGSAMFEFTVVVAFDGLDPQAQTVDDLIFVFAPIVEAGSATVVETPELLDEAFAVYTDVPNDTTYFGQSGDFTIDAITLDPTTEVDPCADAGAPYSCPTVEGTFDGKLDMSALGFQGVTVISNTGLPAGNGTPLDVVADIDVPLSRSTFVE